MQALQQRVLRKGGRCERGGVEPTGARVLVSPGLQAIRLREHVRELLYVSGEGYICH